jgi:hypothetical protein
VVAEPAKPWGWQLDAVVVTQAPVKVWGSELDVVAPTRVAVRPSTLQLPDKNGHLPKAPKAPVTNARFTPGEYHIDAATGKAMLARYENGEPMSAIALAYKVPGGKNAAKLVWHAIARARKAQA